VAAEPGASLPLPALTLVSGPARGGKSRWAEHLAAGSALEVVYLATGPQLPDDPAWQRRLERHRRRRPVHWRSREVGGDLAAALAVLRPGELGLVDSLGTWVAGHIQDGRQDWDRRSDELLGAVGTCRAALVLVCEETGWGVVPSTDVGGRFRDRLGGLQRRVQERCDAAWLVLQGRAVDLLSLGLPVPPD
jgi:adenosylcobinamide kinase/adenosylcobinamide-phosphate guanylyltransferase